MNRLYPLNMDSVLTESLLKQSPKEILHTMIQHMRGQLQVGCFLARGSVYAVGYHQGVEWVMWVTAQESELVIKDLLTRSFRVLRSQLDGALETLSVEGLQHDAILDLDADGTRWEGDGRDGVPFGFGVLYNAHNDKEYEGFRIGDDSWGYGVEFGEDTRARAIHRLDAEGRQVRTKASSSTAAGNRLPSTSRMIFRPTKPSCSRTPSTRSLFPASGS